MLRTSLKSEDSGEQRWTWCRYLSWNIQSSTGDRPKLISTNRSKIITMIKCHKGKESMWWHVSSSQEHLLESGRKGKVSLRQWSFRGHMNLLKVGKCGRMGVKRDKAPRAEGTVHIEEEESGPFSEQAGRSGEWDEDLLGKGRVWPCRVFKFTFRMWVFILRAMRSHPKTSKQGNGIVICEINILTTVWTREWGKGSKERRKVGRRSHRSHWNGWGKKMVA